MFSQPLKSLTGLCLLKCLASRRINQEHAKNYQVLFERISTWLKDDGLLFCHVFCHKALPYNFNAEPDSWMGKYFFTGGTMPSLDLFLYFQQHLTLENMWVVDGKNYATTSEWWLKLQDQNKAAIMPLMVETYGKDANAWFQRWRIFYLACAETFAYNDGQEWFVAHYLFSKKV